MNTHAASQFASPVEIRQELFQVTLKDTIMYFEAGVERPDTLVIVMLLEKQVNKTQVKPSRSIYLNLILRIIYFEIVRVNGQLVSATCLVL